MSFFEDFGSLCVQKGQSNNWSISLKALQNQPMQLIYRARFEVSYSVQFRPIMATNRMVLNTATENHQLNRWLPSSLSDLKQQQILCSFFTTLENWQMKKKWTTWQFEKRKFSMSLMRKLDTQGCETEASSTSFDSFEKLVNLINEPTVTLFLPF